MPLARGLVDKTVQYRSRIWRTQYSHTNLLDLRVRANDVIFAAFNISSGIGLSSRIEGQILNLSP